MPHVLLHPPLSLSLPLCLCVFGCLFCVSTVQPVVFWPAVFESFFILWAHLSFFLSLRSVSVGRVSSGRGSSNGSESCRAGQFWVWRGVQRCSYAQVCVSVKHSHGYICTLLHQADCRWTPLISSSLIVYFAINVQLTVQYSAYSTEAC